MNNIAKMGVWLDLRKAYIVDMNKNESVTEIISDIDKGNLKGGSRSSTLFGPQDVVSEKHMLERRKNQEKKYLVDITDKLRKANQIVILGPAETKHKLLDLLSKRPTFKNKSIRLKTLDSMTLPQIRAEIRNHFDLS